MINSTPPRRWTNEPLPAYAYRLEAGMPHPTADPAGHSYGIEEPPASPLDPDRWQACHGWLRGVDLFNAGYWWEAHEAWEGPWHITEGPARDLLKSTIKLAAALLKREAGRQRGAVKLLGQAAVLQESLIATTGSDRLGGYPLRDHRAMVADAVAGRREARKALIKLT